jgi:hypothetical protein
MFQGFSLPRGRRWDEAATGAIFAQRRFPRPCFRDGFALAGRAAGRSARPPDHASIALSGDMVVDVFMLQSRIAARSAATPHT